MFFDAQVKCGLRVRSISSEAVSGGAVLWFRDNAERGLDGVAEKNRTSGFSVLLDGSA